MGATGNDIIRKTMLSIVGCTLFFSPFGESPYNPIAVTIHTTHSVLHHRTLDCRYTSENGPSVDFVRPFEFKKKSRCRQNT